MSSKVTQHQFEHALESLGDHLGLEYLSPIAMFQQDDDPYPWSLLAKIDRAKHCRNCEELMGQLSSLRSDLQLLLNHLGLQVVTNPQKKAVIKLPAKGKK